jgi:prepilin-type N-terminal cleavage/methylation domain-containing protein
MPKRLHRGFSLLELLVSVTIIAILSTIGFGAYEMFKHRAMMAKELSGARNLLVAFHLYSTNNGGRILEGYQSDPDVVNENGDKLYPPVNARYPWRLYP